jgi:hypothetical protein
MEGEPLAMSDANSLLLEEYKIIQDKIDKLGEDKFKVRSWCFTLLTGGVAAAKFSGSLESKFGPLLLVLFLPAILGFQLVEARQRQISKRLGLRAEAIEQVWKRKAPGLATPQLAKIMIKHSRDEKKYWSAIKYWWGEKLYYEEKTNK